MSAESPDADLGELLTEAVADHGLSLDELTIAQLVALMNDPSGSACPAMSPARSA